MVDIFFLYYNTGKERGKHIKTKEHIKKINNILTESNIKKEYDELKILNKKTTNVDLIKTIKKINEINYKVYDACKNPKLRKEKLEIYIDKQKAEHQVEINSKLKFVVKYCSSFSLFPYNL